MSARVKRRDFITLLGGAAAWPLAAPAQQRAMPVIGFLTGASREPYAPFVTAWRRGLEETGYIEGQNVAIEYRWAEGENDRLPDLAADLVRRRVTAIAAIGGAPPALAAKSATQTIPIVFYTGADPVATSLVVSLNRPGGNLTGITSLNVELGQKQLELLHEILPAATSFALLVNPTSPAISGTQSSDAQAAAFRLGLQVHVVHASADSDLDAIFLTLVQLRAGGLAIAGDAFFTSQIKELAARAVLHRIPAIYGFREFAVAGGLATYGANLIDAHYQSGVYTGRILKGEKPADLPVQQATKVELIINLKTAKALGLEIPPTLLARAAEVIE
jgi:putative tryptophan/tyrosine transport system substrate-binding protein